MELPKPHPSGYDAPFWEAAAAGRLLLQRCVTTGRYQWFPRARSIHVPGGEVEWVDSPGQGTVETFTTVARSFYPALTSYTIAIIRLAEGVLLTSHLVDAEADSIRIGMPVAVTFRSYDNGPAIPCFAGVEVAR